MRTWGKWYFWLLFLQSINVMLIFYFVHDIFTGIYMYIKLWHGYLIGYCVNSPSYRDISNKSLKSKTKTQILLDRFAQNYLDNWGILHPEKACRITLMEWPLEVRATWSSTEYTGEMALRKFRWWVSECQFKEKKYYWELVIYTTIAPTFVLHSTVKCPYNTVIFFPKHSY